MTVSSSPVAIIVPHLTPTDVCVVLAFDPADPAGVAVVEIADADTLTPGRYLVLLDAAARHLAAYAASYREAAETDADADAA